MKHPRTLRGREGTSNQRRDRRRRVERRSNVVGLDGLLTTGTLIDEVSDNMHEAIPIHLEGMRLSGHESREPMPMAKTIHVAS